MMATRWVEFFRLIVYTSLLPGFFPWKSIQGRLDDSIFVMLIFSYGQTEQKKAVFLATPQNFKVVPGGFPTKIGQNVRKTRVFP